MVLYPVEIYEFGAELKSMVPFSQVRPESSAQYSESTTANVPLSAAISPTCLILRGSYRVGPDDQRHCIVTLRVV